MSVYFARSGSYVKIGHSANPIARCCTLTLLGTRPDDLPRGSDVDLIGWIPGNTWDEGSYHARFRDRRVAGEWFRDISDSEVREIIWADPRGVDVQRMSAMAVFVMRQSPQFTRADLERGGVPVAGVAIEEALHSVAFSLDWRSADRDGAA